MMRRPENEHPLSEITHKQANRIFIKQLGETHIPEASMLLYAQAAAGPEYEYPAWLD